MNIQIMKDHVIIDGQIYVKQIEKIDIFYAVKNNSIEKVKQFISQKGNVNVKDEKNQGSYTPLHLSTNVEICKVLIAAGANVNEKTEFGNTPLHLVKNVEICKALIDAGANVNEKNNSGYTPSHTTEVCGHYESAKYLKSLESQTLMDAIKAKNLDFIRNSKELVTMAHILAAKDMPEILEVLLSK